MLCHNSDIIKYRHCPCCLPNFYAPQVHIGTIEVQKMLVLNLLNQMQGRQLINIYYTKPKISFQNISVSSRVGSDALTALNQSQISRYMAKYTETIVEHLAFIFDSQKLKMNRK